MFFFDSETPGTMNGIMNINGLSAGERSSASISARPTAPSMRWDPSSRGSLIDISNGNALAGVAGALTLNGTRFGFDFNPVPDRVRVVSDADQNLRVHPNDGSLTATDGNLNYVGGDTNAGANPNVVGSAYTNSFAGATATTLYGIDSNLDIHATQNPPNSGTLNTVGSLGVNTTDNVAFDISPGTGMAYASLTTGTAANPVSDQPR